VDSFCVVEDQVFGQFRVKQFFIMDAVQVIVDEVFLDGAVVSLHVSVNLGTPGIVDLYSVLTHKILLRILP
jgi:hypothetical protein